MKEVTTIAAVAARETPVYCFSYVSNGVAEAGEVLRVSVGGTVCVVDLTDVDAVEDVPDMPLLGCEIDIDDE